MKIVNQIAIAILTVSASLASYANELIRLECKGTRVYNDNLTGKSEATNHDFLVELNQAKKNAKFKHFMLVPPRNVYDCEFVSDAIMCVVDEKNELKDKMILDVKVSGKQSFFTVFTINRNTGVATERGLSIQNTTALKENVAFEGRYDCNLVKKKF